MSDYYDIMMNRPAEISDPQHPCYPIASVVGEPGLSNEIALHKTHLGAALMSLGGEIINEITMKFRLEYTEKFGYVAMDPLQLLLMEKRYRKVGIDLKHILATLRHAKELSESSMED